MKNSFNEFWSGFFNIEKDYYFDIPLEKLIQMKMVISKINNLVTYESSLLAADLIAEILDISGIDYEKLI